MSTRTRKEKAVSWLAEFCLCVKGLTEALPVPVALGIFRWFSNNTSGGAGGRKGEDMYRSTSMTVALVRLAYFLSLTCVYCRFVHIPCMQVRVSPGRLHACCPVALDIVQVSSLLMIMNAGTFDQILRTMFPPSTAKTVVRCLVRG